MFDIKRTYNFYLDTKFRSGGDLTSPIFNFPNNLINIDDDERIKLTIQEMTIPYTFYQTENYNNKFLIIENGIERIVEISIGNYNIVTFIFELTTKLNSNTSLYNYIVSYIPQINALQYIATPKIGVLLNSVIFNFDSLNIFDIYNINIGESLNEMMGYNNEIINLNLNTTGTAFTSVSTIPITMSPGVENLYITINNSCENFSNTDVNNVFSTSNILGKIPIATPPFSKIFYYDINQNFSTIITNKYLDNLSFTLYNERFTKIIPRKDYSITIKIEIITNSISIESNNTLKELLDINKLKLISK